MSTALTVLSLAALVVCQAPAQPPTFRARIDLVQVDVVVVDRDGLVVMVVDDLHIYKERTDRAKEIARHVLADLGPESSMAVLRGVGRVFRPGKQAGLKGPPYRRWRSLRYCCTRAMSGAKNAGGAVATNCRP